MKSLVGRHVHCLPICSNDCLAWQASLLSQEKDVVQTYGFAVPMYWTWNIAKTKHSDGHFLVASWLKHNEQSWFYEHMDTTVYPKKYAHGFCFAVLCCGYTLTDFPISIRLTSLALWQSNDCPSASKQPWWIWINTLCEFIMNDCITTTKQSTTKPCAYFLGYTVGISEWGLSTITLKTQQLDNKG